jgi:DnaJ-class molecular chaperone
MTDPYSTLGVHKDATPEQIKRAHRRKVRKAHPDTGGSAAEFHEVQSAYLVLADPARRKRFDETGTIDDRALDPMTRAQSDVIKLMVQIVEQSSECDIVAAAMRATISQQSKNQKEVARLKSESYRFAAAAKKLTKTGDGENVVSRALLNQSQTMMQLALQGEEALAHFDRMLAILKEYRYEVGHNQTSNASIFGGSFITIIQ